MPQPLPVIVAMGGVSPAGRTSHHRAYQRLVFPHAGNNQTLQDLAVMQGKMVFSGGGCRDANGNRIDDSNAWLAQNQKSILAGTLVRTLNPQDHFDPHRVPRHRRMRTRAEGNAPISFKIHTRDLPRDIPESWQVHSANGKTEITIQGEQEFLVEDTYEIPLGGAGQFPDSFNPQNLYPSKSHARALSGTLFAISDAMHSSGLGVEELLTRIPPEQVAVYSGSALSQADEYSLGGTISARFLDQRISSRHISFGLPEMSADFANAYALGSTSKIGYSAGACATFLFNLQRGIEDITSGKARIAFVGAAECPLVPPLVEGLMAMGALNTWHKLRELDDLRPDEPIDAYRASRPFCENIGFAPGESCQFALLMDDALALELGADIMGAAPCSHTHADGYKKSISGPGVGNYLTVGRAAAQLRAMLGDKAIKRSFVLAHGSSTPQNRVTESHILDTTARAFGIDAWPVVAIKSHLGHSLAAAGADQLFTALGIWQHGWIPGIETAQQPAADVYRERLNILMKHAEFDPSELPAALLNAKGFGGNNATALILSPQQTLSMLAARHGKKAMTQHAAAHEKVAEKSLAYDAQALRGEYGIAYRFGERVLDGLNPDDMQMNSDSIRLRGFAQPITLRPDNPWSDMC